MRGITYISFIDLTYLEYLPPMLVCDLARVTFDLRVTSGPHHVTSSHLRVTFVHHGMTYDQSLL